LRLNTRDFFPTLDTCRSFIGTLSDSLTNHYTPREKSRAACAACRRSSGSPRLFFRLHIAEWSRGDSVLPQILPQCASAAHSDFASLLSTGFPDHAQSPVFTQPQNQNIAESGRQPIPQMSGLAQPRSSGPIAGGASGQMIAGGGTEEQKGGGSNKAVKTRSLDYVLRSGLAGGLAGCAVSARKS